MRRELANVVGRWSRLRWVHACLLLVLLALLLGQLPLFSAFQIGADEGFELTKATLILKGYPLYSEIWNDQPPLHTFALVQLFRLFSPSIGVARLLTVGCAGLLLLANYLIALRLRGHRCGLLAVLFLLGSPAFLPLATSCMNEIPSLAFGLLTVALLLHSRSRVETPVSPRRHRDDEALIQMRNAEGGARSRSKRLVTSAAASQNDSNQRRYYLLALAGACYGISLAIKPITLLLMPVIMAVWFMEHGFKQSRGIGIRRALVPAVSGLFTLLLLILLSYPGYLANLSASWRSHFGTHRGATDYGSAQQYPFDPLPLLRHWDAWVPALFGGLCLAGKRRSDRGFLLVLGWLLLVVVVFWQHRPWWSYYYVHLAVPLSLAAAVGMTTLIKAASESKVRSVVCGLGLLAAGGWIAARVGLEIQDIRAGARTGSMLILKEIEEHQAGTRWLFAEDAIFSFHTQIPIPPAIALLPFKRFWSGQITSAQLFATLREAHPELVVLRNPSANLLLEEFVRSDYRMVYQDAAHRLYVWRPENRSAK